MAEERVAAPRGQEPVRSIAFLGVKLTPGRKFVGCVEWVGGNGEGSGVGGWVGWVGGWREEAEGGWRDCKGFKELWGGWAEGKGRWLA
jgi:hypothetical protein